MANRWLIERVPRLWALWAASRPSQLLLIVLLYFLGVGMTTTGPPLVASDASANSLAEVVIRPFINQAVGGLGALLPAVIAIHYANEYADADTDAITKRTPFSGGSGALVETDLPASFLRSAFIVVCVVAVGVILVSFFIGLLSTFAVGILSVSLVIGIAYSLPPVALVRRGIGEPINMVLGGLHLPVYGVAVMATPTVDAALAVVPFMLIVGCNLLAVHWPDRMADERVGKRTIAVAWSPKRIRLGYTALVISATLVTLGLWWTGTLPDIVALAHLAPIPFLVWGWITLTRQRSPFPVVAAMVVLGVTLTLTWWWVGIA